MKTRIIGLIALLLVCASGWSQTYKRLTNLPHVYIETEGRKSITSKSTYIYATMHYVDEQDSIAVFDSMQIRGRGNSTWNMSKKPYRIKFQKKEKLLGKGYANAKSWTLMANAGDKTMFRNAITSLLGDFLGMKNNPAHKFVDMTLNGSYQGTYQISDQVEVRPHRVNIAEQDYPVTETSNITGGYLLEMDGFYDGVGFRTSRNVYSRIHYPDEEELTTAQKNYISNHVNTFEKALFGNNFTDPVKGYRPYVDSLSLSYWYLATEISANIDGFYSTYYYKDMDDDRLFFGPLWDYDIAYNNDYRISGTQNKLMVEDGYGTDLAKVWVKQFYNDPWFVKMINRDFNAAIDNGVEDYLYQQIDSISSLLTKSQQRNYSKWGIDTRMYHEIVLYSSYSQYVTDVKNFIKNHLTYLKKRFAEKLAEVTPEEPEQDPITSPDAEHWFRIIHSGSDKSFVVNNDNNICVWTSNQGDETQLWRFEPIGEYFMVINKRDELALNDPTKGSPTATTLTGTNLNVAEQDSTDHRQLWILTPQDNGATYNLTNLFSQHTANLSGGNTQDGSSILSYTTDTRNSTSNNRKWRLLAEEDYERPTTDPTAIDEPEPDEYALAYNSATRTLHFGSETPEHLNFNVSIYDMNGRCVRTFVANTSCQVNDLPKGMYIIRWQVGGQTRTTKLQLR